ncbi:DNA polymerase III subunit tau [Caloramator mitchellensis]|uniref:DNA-directed DNA polymerase n=1 Tax=Caloramator mitchellensis TaxID=908809 RepID=A0A0R3JVB4_CALMK|nr:DNA polymerase III subunit gamma/tau [Caloramator mitchellensis]KRQ86221.1 DNA polymerase III subunit tau [Caloramator mitchellensis]
MKIALYREWRPRNFDEVVGQEAIVKTLKNQINTNRISHAYLFSGTRGTGKTSTARIFAKAINCLNPQDANPCNECEICKEINKGTFLDFVELDAASNNRVENARDLIDTVSIPPTRAKYKVYLIDEVHMLSNHAFNALLKTLEEPPEYAIFILATTDPQKVPLTILSRCQRFNFKRIKKQEIKNRLQLILNELNVECDDNTLDLIAANSDGALRDALSLLDQLVSMMNGRLNYDDVLSLLGFASKEKIFKLIDLIVEKDVQSSIKLIDDIILEGKDVINFIGEMIEHLRNLLMVKVSKNPLEIIDASNDYINRLKLQAGKLRSEEIMRGINIFVEAENDAKTYMQPRIAIEMAIIKFCRIEYDVSLEVILNRVNKLEEMIKSGRINVEKVEALEKKTKPSAPEKVLEAEDKVIEKPIVEEAAVTSVTISLDEARIAWQDVLNYLKMNKKMSLASLLNLGDVTDVKSGEVVITFENKYSFSKKKIEEGDNKKHIVEAFSKVLKKPVRVRLNVLEEKNELDEGIKRAKELFGEDLVEVLE